MERRRLVEASPSMSGHPANFCRVSELRAEPCLSFGDEELDKFCEGLCLGRVILLHGSWKCLATSELLCVRTQLSPHQGGFDSDAIFIDGGNTFDPYLITQYAEQFSSDRDRVLDRIFVARAFTCHQLTTLITQTLPDAIQRRAKLTVISDMIELYHDHYQRSVQSFDLFKIALNSIVSTARAEKAIILVTSLDERRSDPDPFLRIAKRHVDMVLRFEEQPYSTRLTLEKHPTRPKESFLIKQPAPRVLEEFLETTENG